jgi:hypothetical protein
MARPTDLDDTKIRDLLVAHVWLSNACMYPQVGDHVSVWYSRGSGLWQGWYDGQVEAVRPRATKNVSF